MRGVQVIGLVGQRLCGELVTGLLPLPDWKASRDKMPETLINLSTPKRKMRGPSAKALRHVVMAFFFLFLLHVAYDHQVRGGGPRGTPSVEAYCPFGGLETLYQFVITGDSSAASSLPL